MKFSNAFVAAFLACGAAADGPSPMSKVLELLSDLQQKIIKEGEDAQKIFQELEGMCEDRSAQLHNEIKNGKSSVQRSKADIDKAASSIAALTTKAERLASDISTDEADLKAATEIRAKEAKSFAAEEKELMDIVDTLARAIRILEREAKGASMLELKGAETVQQALSVLVQGSMLSSADATRLTALVQTESDDAGAPAGAVYKNSSGGIVETLTNLLETSQEQLDAARKQETESIHAFQLTEQSLQDEVKFAQKELGETKSTSFSTGEQKAKTEGALAMAEKELASNNKALDALHHRCMTKSQTFEEETRNRGDELQAIKDAKQVLQDTTAGASGISYGQGQSFVQVSSQSRANLVQIEAVHILRDLARKQDAPELAQLASRVSLAMRSGEDPFGKIKGLIQNMIQKLESEASKDADKKAYCDKELAETNAKKDDKTADVSKLSTQIDKMSARSSQLKEEVAALQKGLGELAKMQAEMDKIRIDERDSFRRNKAELEQGLKGVKQALRVLGEYYGKTGQAEGAADGGRSGILGLLEVVESDFTKNLAEATATEEGAQNDYDEDTKSNAVEKTTKSADVDYMSKESSQLDRGVAETASDRSNTQTQLDAVADYLRKVEAQCIAKAESHESRQARFKAEIEGLKEALRVLESETAFVQSSSAHRLLRGSRQGVLSTQ